MKDRLFIRLMADNESVEWGLINTQESTVTFLDRGNLLLDDIVALAEMAEANPVTMLIPSHKVRSFAIDAPTKNRKHLEKAVPYLLEEQVIESVETQHFAIGDVNAANQLSVNVVSKQYLTGLLNQLSEAGVEVDELYADAASLPVFDDAWSMLDSEVALVRQDANSFWAASKDMLADMLKWNLSELAQEEQTLTQAIRVFTTNQEQSGLDSVPGLAVQFMPIDDELEWLASQNRENSINLLQQAYTSNKKSNTDMSQWKLPLIAASVLLISGLVYLGSELFILKKERDEYRQQALMEVQKLSPNIDDSRLDSKIVEINNLYRKAAGGSGQVSGLISLMDMVYDKLDPNQVKLEQLDFNSKQGTMNLDVRAQNYQVLTAAQQQLEQSGLNVEMRNARDNNGSWTTRLVVKVN
ncbi:MAG: general secretion pathway protein GspL [Gammaproteobacteria bacterium]|nr:general secretion pathway protein GspL [Gammaproteobacteria bacterium]